MAPCDGFESIIREIIENVYGRTEAKGISYDSLLDRQLARLSELAENRNLTAEELQELAYDETIAEMSETMLTDTDAAQRVSQELYKKDRTLWEKIKDFFTGLVEKLRNAYKGVDPDSDMGRVMKRAISDNEKVAQAWAEAVVEAGENYQLQDGQKNNAREGERYSNRNSQTVYDYSKPFAEQIDDWIANRIPSRDTLVVSGTPEVFKGIGMPALPVTINSTHIDYALNGTKDFDHELGKDLLKQLPEAIKKPVAIMTSGTKASSSVVAMLEIRHNGKQVVVPVAVGGFGYQNGIRIDSNAVTSAYGKNSSISRTLYDAIAAENSGDFRLYYLDTQKATALLQGAKVPMPKMPATHNGGYIHSLADAGSPVKLKISSVTESQQFKRWFGDWQKNPAKASKVVNEDGTPKVVYHGSPADFNTFSLKYLGTNGTNEGYGFYFTDDKEIAESYSKGTEAQRHQGADGKLFEVYLDIKKPLSDTEVTMRRSEFRKFLMEMNKQVDEDGEPLDFLSNYGDVSWEGLQSVINSAMEVEYDGSDSDVNMIHSIINGCGNMEMVFNVLRKTTGYDGIIVKDATWGGDQTIYVAFNPNQIKSATDNVGTFDKGNPDIRFSSRNTQESQVERLARKNEELKAEAEYLRQVVQIQKRGNTRNLRDRESVNAVAKSILESVNAKDTEFGKKLNDFYRDMVTVEMDYDAMRERAGELADRALEHHQAERDGYA